MEYKKTFFERLFGSIATPSMAVNVKESLISGAFGYFVKLCLFSALVFSVAIAIKMYPMGGVETVMKAMEKAVPDFQLKDGVMNYGISEPYVYEADDAVIIFENNDSKSLFQKYENAAERMAYFSTKEMIIINGTRTNSLEFKKIEFDFSRDTFFKFIKNLAWFVCVFIFLGIFIGSLIGGVWLALWISIASLITDAIVKTQIGFKKLYALALHALTASALIDLVCMCANTFYHMGLRINFFIKFIITLIYMIIYICCISAHEKEKELEEKIRQSKENYKPSDSEIF